VARAHREAGRRAGRVATPTASSWANCSTRSGCKAHGGGHPGPLPVDAGCSKACHGAGQSDHAGNSGCRSSRPRRGDPPARRGPFLLAPVKSERRLLRGEGGVEKALRNAAPSLRRLAPRRPQDTMRRDRPGGTGGNGAAPKRRVGLGARHEAAQPSRSRLAAQRDRQCSAPGASYSASLDTG
jgi:hypothetical protein